MFMDIKFKGSIRKWSNSYVVTIPITLVNSDLLKEDVEYEFVAKEVKP